MKHQVIAALAVLSVVGVLAWRHSSEDFEAFALLVGIYGGLALLVGLSFALSGVENLWRRLFQEPDRDCPVALNEEEKPHE
jgi:hypothetical protein